MKMSEDGRNVGVQISMQTVFILAGFAIGVVFGRNTVRKEGR